MSRASPKKSSEFSFYFLYLVKVPGNCEATFDPKII